MTATLDKATALLALRGALAEAMDPKPCVIHVYRLQKERHDYYKEVHITSGPNKGRLPSREHVRTLEFEEGTCIRCGAKKLG
jgi:hypothetical protein